MVPNFQRFLHRERGTRDHQEGVNYESPISGPKPLLGCLVGCLVGWLHVCLAGYLGVR